MTDRLIVAVIVAGMTAVLLCQVVQAQPMVDYCERCWWCIECYLR